MNITTKLLLTTALGFAAACAVPASSEEAPIAEGDVLGETATITYGTLTATANQPVSMQFAGTVRGSAAFSGGTAKMGVCTLQLREDVPCTTAADCAALPVGSGGSRYCTNPNNSGQKYCALRLGAATAWCAGSPAQGGVAVAPGTYTTPAQQITDTVTHWVSYACFNGCSGSTADPSVSSTETVILQCQVSPPPGCGAAYCIDFGCDGTIESCRTSSGNKTFCN